MNLKGLVEDTSWLFDFGFPIRRFDAPGDPSRSPNWDLGEEYRLPGLNRLCSVSREFSAKMAWGAQGAFLQIEYPIIVAQGALFEFSSILQLYIDTRSSPGIHRASANCHCLDFRCIQPYSNRFESRPMRAELLQIARAKASPKPMPPGSAVGWCSADERSIHIHAFVGMEALTGCDPFEFPEWGVMFVVIDSQYRRYSLARMTQAVPMDDPSLWCRARLINQDTGAGP